MNKIYTNMLLAAASVMLIYVVGRCSYNWALRFTSHPPTKAISRHSTPPYLTKKEREEYKTYLMSQKNETDFMRWDEWKLSKVFTVTLSQLEASIENK